MPYGYGSGRGGGTGLGRGGGRGLGFRGTSPGWPYVGRGRGGLPRCEYYYAGNTAFPASYIQNRPVNTGTGTIPGYVPNPSSMSKDEELSFMKNQAEAIKEKLEQIDKRIHELEPEK
jgi:hypothetical protein